VKAIVSAIDNVLQILYDYIIMISGTFVTIMIMTGAFLRYVLNVDFYGSEEIILIFGFWLYFIGSISAARSKSHLNANMITVFTKNERIISVAGIIKDILSLAICILAIKWCSDYWAWSVALKPKTSVHKIPYYFQQFPMFLSFIMWGLYLVRDTYNAIMAFKKSEKRSLKFTQGGNS